MDRLRPHDQRCATPPRLRQLGSVLVGALLVLVLHPCRGWARSRGINRSSTDAKLAGSQACSECHPDKAGALETPMGHALSLPQDAPVLRIRPRLSFRNGRYTYDIVTTATGSDCSVTDGSRTLSAPIVWVIGYGSVGQTYILSYRGRYFESQVSYYAEAQGLGITVGHSRQPPRHIEDATGYRLDETSLQQCLNCHATSALRDGRLTLDQMSPGIGCERCHGPGAAHIAAVKSGKNLSNLQISNPGRLSAGNVTGFCASCHRTQQDVSQLSVQGVETVRFQAYRLERSRCYNPSDRRITCTACHDPHQPLDRIAGSYDARCLACHDGHSKHARICSVGTRDCVSCHMPEVRVPEADATFRDHWIRIAKPNEPYPD